MYSSAGHSADEPEQTSSLSHVGSTLARHTVPEPASWHDEVQHSELLGSQTAPLLNLHVDVSQHDDVEPGGGSQSSPSSTMPLPHDCKEMIRGLDGKPGRTRHVVFRELEIVVQMLPIEHGEKLLVLRAETGDMM